MGIIRNTRAGKLNLNVGSLHPLTRPRLKGHEWHFPLSHHKEEPIKEGFILFEKELHFPNAGTF